MYILFAYIGDRADIFFTQSNQFLYFLRDGQMSVVFGFFLSFFRSRSCEQFLWPFQSFSNSKGRHALKHNGIRFGLDVDTLENDAPFSGLNAASFIDDAENITALSSVAQDSIKFEWMISPWSECSQSCGTEVGFRVCLFYSG